MKKTLLLASLTLGALTSFGQITTYVLQPPELEGPLDFTWADNWGQTPDLNDPANSVTAFAMFVNDGNDGTADDSLACNPLTNGPDMTGKIAVLYRGNCEFGLKALNAEQAGAEAVVIINNQGAPVGMGAGVNGGEVTIPVVMISTDAGAMLRDEILAGNVEMLIGSVANVFQYNLHTSKALALIPEASGMPKWLATNGSEFSATLGTWVKNFGSEDQSNVSVTGHIMQDGTEVYNNTSVAVTIASGDSAFFALPAFSQASGYNGYYVGTYTINSPNTDEFPSDNTFNFNMLFDSLYALARIDPATKQPIGSEYYQPSGSTGNFGNCIHFRNANASRVKVEGFYIGSSRMGGGDVSQDALEVRIIEWNDNFTTVDQATFNNLVPVVTADYYYEENLASQIVYAPLDQYYTLENNQRYLFCLYTVDPDVFLPYNTTTDYTKTQDEYLNPYTIVDNAGTWFWAGFGTDVVSAIGVKMVPVEVGMNDLDRVEVTPYPNPTSSTITIPLAGQSGAATLEVFDLAGVKVAERRVSVANNGLLTMDVSDIANGAYLFNMNFENGKHASFRVVVAK
jgi:hypothetical protein